MSSNELTERDLFQIARFTQAMQTTKLEQLNLAALLVKNLHKWDWIGGFSPHKQGDSLVDMGTFKDKETGQLLAVFFCNVVLDKKGEDFGYSALKDHIKSISSVAENGQTFLVMGRLVEVYESSGDPDTIAAPMGLMISKEGASRCFYNNGLDTTINELISEHHQRIKQLGGDLSISISQDNWFREGEDFKKFIEGFIETSTPKSIADLEASSPVH